MVIEEVIVGSEEAVDARSLDHAGELLDEPCGTAEAEGALVVGVDRAVRAVKFAAVRHDDCQDLREPAQTVDGYRPRI